MPDASKPTGLSSFDVLSIGIKLIGVSLLLTAVMRLGGAFSSIVISYSREYVPVATFFHPIFDIQVITIAVLKISFAVVFMFCGDRIARKLSSNSYLVSSPRDGLCIAAKLIGIYLVAVGIPYILEYLASAFNIGVLFRFKSAQNLNLANICHHSLPAIIGIYLITGARHMLDLAYGRLARVEEANEAL
jgi:hypothetical protein